jgi:hypothetical protein
MEGQFFAKVDNDKGERVGEAYTCVDPGQSEGHLIYNPGQATGYRVGLLRLERAEGSDLAGNIVPHPSYEQAYRVPPEQQVPASTNIKVQLKSVDSNTYEGTWSSEDGKSGRVQLMRMWIGGESTPTEHFDDWELYKQWADKYVNSGCAFRGQAHARLISTFHRTGRVDLVRYLNRDLPYFADYLDTLTGRSYDLRRPEDFGAVLGLAQHHGFPTPLLDWTYSPYVAAYFAFAQVVEQRSPPASVRIYRLSSAAVREGLDIPVLDFVIPRPAVVAFRPISRGNARLLNQQGLFTFSNLADIETILRWQEDAERPKQLEHVEISSRVARRALSDLRNMGTTAATLFPGLDGSSTFLKHLLFYS